jgi:putative transcriptional regulator
MYSLVYIEKESLMGNLKPKIQIKNNLHVLRASLKITQAELALAIGVTRATVNAMENGDYNPSLELAFRLSLFFKKDIQEIFTVGDENEKI